jgi:hypothetical protein
MTNLDEHNELEHLAPFLSKMKKEDGFTVPENYFEELPSRIQRRINSEKYYKTKVIGLSKNKFIQIAAAACFMIIAGYFITTETIKKNDPLAGITIQDLDMNDFDSEMIIDVAGNVYIKQEPTEMDNYIINHIDEDILIEQL